MTNFHDRIRTSNSRTAIIPKEARYDEKEKWKKVKKEIKRIFELDLSCSICLN